MKFLKGKKQAVICVIFSAFFFSLMSTFVRLSGDLPTFQKAFFRNIIALIVVTIYMLFKKESFLPKKQAIMPIFGRAVFGLAGIILNFMAIDNLNIADAAILNKMSPFFTVLFTALLLKEKIGKIDILFLLIAFSGALFVVKPTFNFTSPYAYVGLASGLAVGVAYTFLRVCGRRGEQGTKIVFWFSLFSTIVLTPLFIINYQPISNLQLLYLCLAGASAGCAQFFVTIAYTRATAKEVSVFDYSQVVFAAILGVIVLGQTPDVFSIIGYVIIVGVSLIKWLLDVKKNTQTSTELEAENLKNS